MRVTESLSGVAKSLETQPRLCSEDAELNCELLLS
jgi:hypothetical protein